MKRILLTHEEFLSEGIAAALHVNARTDRDWSRLMAYIASREEITHLAFEFATGAGSPARVLWYANQLLELTRGVSRPLHLLVRGGASVLPMLRASYSEITVLETNSFMKTVYRQQLKLSSDGKQNAKSLTMDGLESLDELLSHNWEMTVRSMNSSVGTGLVKDQWS